MPSAQTSWGERALTQLFGSEVRAKVVSWIAMRPNEPIIGRELARALGSNAAAVGRELRQLADLGMLRVGEPIGRAKPYHLNEHFPLLHGLRLMVLYAVGAVALLRERLGNRDDIAAAFVFGSVAAGDDRPASDVDLMVIGDISASDLASVLREVEGATRREISDVHYSVAEFRRRTREGGSFLPTVLGGAKVFVKGDQDALRELGE